MRSFDEDILNVSSHFWIAQHLIAFIDHKELALVELDELVLGQIVKPARRGDDHVWRACRILQFCLIFFKGNSSEVAAEPQIWIFEVAAWVTVGVPSLLKSLKI